MATLQFKGKSAVWNHHLSVPERENKFRPYLGFFNLLNDLRAGIKKYHAGLVASENLQQDHDRYIQETRGE